MSVEVQAKNTSGSLGTPQMGPADYLIVQDEFSRYCEEGRMYATTHQGTGIITQAGLSATDAVIALHNPAGSGKSLKLWYCAVQVKVANGAAAVFWLAANTNANAAIVSGTAAVVRNLKLGGGATNNQGQAALALTTATLPAAPVAICTLGVGLTGAITTVPGVPMFERYFKGALIVQPGTSLSFQSSTASGAAATHGEFIWSEHSLIS